MRWDWLKEPNAPLGWEDLDQCLVIIDGDPVAPAERTAARMGLVELAERGAVVVAPSATPAALPRHERIIPAGVIERQEGDLRELTTIASAARALIVHPRAPLHLGNILHLRPCSQHPAEVRAGWGHLPCDCREHQENPFDWIIVDGPRGPEAKPMRPAWVRALRDQAAAATVPFAFIGWGTWAPHEPRGGVTFEQMALFNSHETGEQPVLIRDLAEDRREGWAEYQGKDDVFMYEHANPDASGRELDGKVYDERPEIAR